MNDTDEIKLEVATTVAHDVQHLTGRPVGQMQDRPHDRRQVDEEPVYDLVGPALNALDAAYGLHHVQADQGARLVVPADVPAPLIPAITHYDRTIEDIAREKAKPSLEHDMQVVRSVGREVYVDPEQAAATLSAAIVDKGIEGRVLARSLIETPEQFAPLRGKVGLLGENKERKLARHYAHALGNHVLFAAQTWQRRLEAERKSETWKRERQDIVEVPGLTERSQALLQQFDTQALEDRPTFLKQLLATPEGQSALAEARTITAALEQRFGSADPRNLKPDALRLEPDLAKQLDRIKHVARIVERAQRAELTQQYELKQSLRKGLALRM